MRLVWDYRFLALAREISSWSKDPSTKVGAVIVRPDKTIASMGFNGFPKGMSDSAELYADRGIKYSRIIHAEMNAILFAREPLHGYTLYTYPFFCCERCILHVIQAGISRIVSIEYGDEETGARWDKPLKKAKDYAIEAGVETMIYDKRWLDR